MKSLRKRASRPFCILLALMPVVHPLSADATFDDKRRAAGQSGFARRLSVSDAQLKFASMPLHFEANQGQARPGVKFLARGPGYSALLLPNEIVLALQRSEGPAASIETGKAKASALLRLRFGRANALRFEGENELPGKINYMLGSDPSQWRTNVTTFARIRCREVYPGIDVVYYGNQQRLEYDFVVAPGANPESIELQFDGAESIEIDEAGDLLLRLSGGEVRQRRPVVYQEVSGTRRPIEGNYQRVGADQVRFAVGEYDRSRPLVIDPVLEYASYFGSSAGDGAAGIAVDASGYAVVVGFTWSFDNFPFKNAYQDHTDPRIGGPGVAANGNAFVMRIAPDGTLVYATYLGGEEYDEAHAVAVDNASNAYVTGVTQSRPGFGGHGGFPTTEGAYKTTFPNFSTPFVSKFSAAGGLVYSTFLFTDLSGGAYEGNGIAVDGNGYALVTGAHRTFDAMFVAKLNLAGSGLVYTNVINAGIGYAIAVDSAGAAHIAGNTVSGSFSQFFPTTPNAYETNSSIFQLSRAFYMKLDENGTNRLYCTLIGSRNDSTGRGMAVDGLGHAHITGSIRQPNNPANLQYGDFRPKNALQSQFGGGLTDAYIARFDPSQSGTNSLLYATYLGGSGDDRAASIAVDEISRMYVAGTTTSTNFPVVDALQTNHAGGVSDAFVAQLNDAGSGLIFSTYLGGDGNENANGVAMGLAGVNLYVAGTTGSTNFPVWNAVQPNLKGTGTDAFVTRIRLGSEAQLIAIEVTQALQDWKNTVPLVKGKPTYVRAFVELDGRGDPKRVQPVLHGRRNDVALPRSPLRPLNASGFIVAKPDAASRRDTWEDSLNFRLPESWTEGTIELRVEAQDLVCAEGAAVSPNDCKVSVEFQEVPKVKVKFVGIQWRDPAFQIHPPGAPPLRKLAARLKASYPTPALDAKFERAHWSLQFQLNASNNWFPHKELMRVNERLLLQYEQEVKESREDPAQLYYGALLHSSDEIPLAALSGAGLAAGTPGRVASGFFSANSFLISRHVHTHELAHALGRPHSVHSQFVPDPGVCPPGLKTGVCDECALASVPDYPLFELLDGNQVPALGPLNQSIYEYAFGLDTSPFEFFQGADGSRIPPFVISPFEYFDLMSYCGVEPLGQWPSIYTYTNLLDAIKARFAPGGSPPPPGPRQAFFYVRGAIDYDTETVSFQPFTRLNVSSPTVAPPGEFKIRLLDAANSVLQEIPFAPMISSAFGPDPNTALFIIPALDNPAIRQVEVLRGAQLFGKKVASANPPSVRVLSPNGGEIADGETLLIQWEASDPDGDALTFDVQYSSDNGTNWSTLLIDGTQQQIEAPLFNRKGGTQARVRVTAKDGFHSTRDESDAAFTLQEQPSTVTILSPRPFENFSGQQEILFEGSAVDATDGELSGTNLVWRSNRDGVLGNGQSVFRNAALLSLGIHTITLAATDSDGSTVESSIQISVTTIIAPRIQAATLLAGGNFELEVFGEMGTQVTLESSTNLSNWVTVQSSMFESDVLRFTIPLNQSEAHRFFRAVASP